MDFGDRSPKVVRHISSNDVLVLVNRVASDGWFDVVDVKSGSEGWVKQREVKISLTQHPGQGPQMIEENVGSDVLPKVSVENSTGKVMNLKIVDPEIPINYTYNQ